jgi:hypothetical protein
VADDIETWADANAWRGHTAAVLNEVLLERIRVVETEGFTPLHDDAHDDGQIASAAAAYARLAGRPGRTGAAHAPVYWPWDARWWKPKDDRRDLIRAAQLIIAEVCRLDRKEARARIARRREEEAAAKAEPACRVLASLNVDAAALAGPLSSLPGTIRIIGSEASQAPHTVRLLLDVTATGLPGGDWIAQVRDEGGRRVAEFRPVGEVKADRGQP